MKTEKVDINIFEYQGRKDFPGLPIQEKLDVEIFENVPELRAAGAFPSDSDVLDMVNASRKASARAKRTTELTKSFKTVYEQSDEFKVKNFVKAAKLAKLSLSDVETMVAKQFPSYQGDALAGYDA